MLIDRHSERVTISSEESVTNAVQEKCQTGSSTISHTSEPGGLEDVFTDDQIHQWLARPKDADLTKPGQRGAQPEGSL